MRTKYFVGIDCGTQSAKVAIVTSDGAIVAEGRQPLRPMLRPRHGHVLHPDDDLWTAIGSASQQAMHAFGKTTNGDAADLAGVGICPVRCCKAFLDTDGNLVEPVMSWMDERAYSPYVPNDPSLRYATTASGYITHRMTGRFVDTAANSIVGQWPIDPRSWRWSEDAHTLNQFGLAREQLFELVLPGEIVGAITTSAATFTGLPEGIPVVATSNDKAVEFLGAGPVPSTGALLSLGTYIAAMTGGDQYHESPSNFWTNFACAPHRYLFESNGIRRGMWTLTWFLDLLGPEFAQAATAQNVSREQYLEREAANVAPGSAGLTTVLDWLAPGDKPHRKGIMAGFDARHGRGHIYRSIMEAIALAMKHNVDAMMNELGRTNSDLVVSGGGASSPLFMQILADVFNVPTSSTTGGAALGSAMCAAAATGTYPDIESATEAMKPAREKFTPNPSHAGTYQRIGSDVAHRLRAATDGFLAQSYPLFNEN